MAWVEDDIISVRLDQTSQGEDALNKLFYRIVSIVAETIIREVLLALVEQLTGQMAILQTVQWAHVSQQVLNETNGLDFEDYGELEVGVLSDASPVPTYVSVGMTKTVANRLTRPGGIRIGGVVSTAFEGNDLTAAFVDAYKDLGETLASEQVFSDSGVGSITLQPVVVGRNVDGSLDLLRINDVVDVDKPRITSQVSRRKTIG